MDMDKFVASQEAAHWALPSKKLHEFLAGHLAVVHMTSVSVAANLICELALPPPSYHVHCRLAGIHPYNTGKTHTRMCLASAALRKA